MLFVMGNGRLVAALIAAGVLVLGTAAGAAAWQTTDPCRDLTSSDGLPLAPTTDDYLGLALPEAVALGEQRGVALVRVTCQDRRPRLVTADLRADRINVGLSNGKVVSAAAF